MPQNKNHPRGKENKSKRFQIWAVIVAVFTGGWLLLEHFGTLAEVGKAIDEFKRDHEPVTVANPESVLIGYNPSNETLNLSLPLVFTNPHSRAETLKPTAGFFGVLGDKPGSAQIDSDSTVFKDGDRSIGSTTELNPNSGSNIATSIILKIGTTLKSVLKNSTTGRQLELDFEVGDQKLPLPVTFDIGEDRRNDLSRAMRNKDSISFTIATRPIK
jgi:hypothetical protein